MALPGVNITINKGGLGRTTPQTTQTALIILGEALSPKLIFSPKDVTGTGLLKKEVSTFYERTGEGVPLWVAGLADAPTLVKAISVENGESIAEQLLRISKGKVSVLALNGLPGAKKNPAPAHGIDDDVVAAIEKAQLLATRYQKKNEPLRLLLPALNFDPTKIATLKDLRTLSADRVGVVLGANRKDGSAAMGILLAKIATQTPHINIGRVKDGAAILTEAYTTAKDNTDTHRNAYDALHDKGYIFFRDIFGKSGYYFNDDPVATALSDDVSSLSKGLVLDKAQRLAYDVLANEILENIPTDPNTGKMSGAVAAYYESIIEESLRRELVDRGSASAVKVVVPLDQDILATDTMEVLIRVVPVGSIKRMEVRLGYTKKIG